MVTIAIIGILAGVAFPLADRYRMKAEYTAIMTTLRYLMDGEETYFLDNNTFYPQGFGLVSIPQGQIWTIPELNYTFPPGHKHTYLLRGFNFGFGSTKIN